MNKCSIKRLLSVAVCICLMAGMLWGALTFAENASYAAFAQATSYSTLTYGLRDNDEVSNMQRRLRELGFFDGNATGGYWDQTASAVKAFQEAAGLPVDRKTASAEMLALLFSSDAPTADGKPVATIQDKDSVIFFNYRSDRAREMTFAFTDNNFLWKDI